MNKLTLDLIIEVLGEPEKQSGDEYFWQCPMCKDSGRDNLKFNSAKGVLWCFADNNHAPMILREILQKNKGKLNLKLNSDCNNTDRFKHIFTKQKQLEFKFYMQECNERLQTIDMLMQFTLLQQKTLLMISQIKHIG